MPLYQPTGVNQEFVDKSSEGREEELLESLLNRTSTIAKTGMQLKRDVQESTDTQSTREMVTPKNNGSLDKSASTVHQFVRSFLKNGNFPKVLMALFCALLTHVWEVLKAG